MMKKLTLSFLCLALLSGCTQTRILEEINIITAVGYDPDEDSNMLRTTSVIENMEPGKEGTSRVRNSKGHTSKGAKNSLSLNASRLSASGQVRLALYGRQLAEEKGIVSIADTLSRDPSIGSLVYMVVAENEARDIMSHNYKDIPNIGEYLYRLIEHNIEQHSIPSCTIHEFLKYYYSDGRDPILPIISRKNNEVGISKMALFNGDKLVGDIDTKYLFNIQLLLNNASRQQREMKISIENIPFEKKALEEKEDIKNNFHILFDVIDIHTVILLTNQSKTEPEFKIHTNMTISLSEIDERINLSGENIKKQISTEINNNIKEETLELLSVLKDRQADVIGFGEIYNRKNKITNSTSEEWRKKFSRAQFNIEVNTKITRTGARE
ncbi:Ger(x)C family spore germination protein [Cytobacillus sp. FJAT-54145]|uniref:Ger(X)C family spore germination protein n=1 Tax=Cytobacillus spartinae TaxID=3299023 RepID=A0ABW6KDW5_9BACI